MARDIGMDGKVATFHSLQTKLGRLTERVAKLETERVISPPQGDYSLLHGALKQLLYALESEHKLNGDTVMRMAYARTVLGGT